MKLLTRFRHLTHFCVTPFRSRAVLVALVVLSAAVFAGVQLVTAVIASPQATPPSGDTNPLFGSVETSGDVKVGQFLRVGNAIKPSGISPSVLVDPNLDIGKALRVDSISHYGAGATSVAINDSVNVSGSLTVQKNLDLGGPWIKNADGMPIPPYLQAFYLGATKYPPKSLTVNAPGGTTISGGLSTDDFFVKSGTISTLPGQYLNLGISDGLKTYSVVGKNNSSPLLLGGAVGVHIGEAVNTVKGTVSTGATLTPTADGLLFNSGIMFQPSGTLTAGQSFPRITTDTHGDYFLFNKSLRTRAIAINNLNDLDGETNVVSALMAKETDLYLPLGGLITNTISSDAKPGAKPSVTLNLSGDMFTVKSPVNSFQGGTTWLTDTLVAGKLQVNGQLNAASVGKWTYARNTFNFKNNTNQLPVVAAVCPANSVVVGCTGDIDMGSVKSGNLTLLNYLGTLIPNWAASFSAGGVNVPGNRVCLGRARQGSTQPFSDSAIFAVQASCFSPQG